MTTLAIIGVIVVASTLVGCLAGRRRSVDLEEWAVGGRGLGTVMVWLLLAGETFTTYSLLGLSGWAYLKGAPVLYSMIYLPLGQIGVYLLGPLQWEAGRRYGLVTLPDFFQKRYGGVWLCALVAVSGLVFMLVYFQLQLTGLGLIVEFASEGAISRSMAIVLSSLLIAVFVFASGVRGIAWVSIIKDGFMTLAALVAGFAIPAIRFGGVAPMFHRLVQDHPAHFTMPGSTPNLGHTWYMTSVILSAIGLGTWPHTFGSRFTARSAQVLRTSAISMPLYTLALMAILFVGFGAIELVPGLKVGDLAFLAAVKATFPAWFLGVVGAAGALTAMVPASVLLLTSATIVAKNLWPATTGCTLSPQASARAARWVVLVFCGLGIGMALHGTPTIAALLLLAYSGVAQFFPGFLFGLLWPRANRAGVGAGLVVGLLVAGILTLRGLDPIGGFNAGFVGLAANLAVAVGVSLATRPQPDGLSGVPAASDPVPSLEPAAEA